MSAEKYAGADWIEGTLKRSLSPLGRTVADILGQVYRGIYHLDHGSTIRKPDWQDERYIEVNVPQGLSTYDGDDLTAPVIAVHEAPVRLNIDSGGPRRLRLAFSPRQRGGRLFERHPTIEEARCRLESAPRTPGREVGAGEMGLDFLTDALDLTGYNRVLVYTRDPECRVEMSDGVDPEYWVDVMLEALALGSRASDTWVSNTVVYDPSRGRYAIAFEHVTSKFLRVRTPSYSPVEAHLGQYKGPFGRPHKLQPRRISYTDIQEPSV